jgi:hypothetical protein
MREKALLEFLKPESTATVVYGSVFLEKEESLGIKIPKDQCALIDIEPGGLLQQGDTGGFYLIGIRSPGAGIPINPGDVGDRDRLSQGSIAAGKAPAPIYKTTYIPIFTEFQGEIYPGTNRHYRLVATIIGDQMPGGPGQLGRSVRRTGGKK